MVQQNNTMTSNYEYLPTRLNKKVLIAQYVFDNNQYVKYEYNKEKVIVPTLDDRGKSARRPLFLSMDRYFELYLDIIYTNTNNFICNKQVYKAGT